ERFAGSGGLLLEGSFYGAGRERLSGSARRLCLDESAVSHGILAVGKPGSASTYGVILPAVRWAMQQGHSLIVSDLYGELLRPIVACARETGHRLMVHDPSEKFEAVTTAVWPVRVNLTRHIRGGAMACQVALALLRQDARSRNRFWTEKAAL